MSDIKVSVICSVYNNELYIRQCIDSILNQTLSNMEIILIDNGCTDSCPKIIDDYAQNDKRIIAVHNQYGSTYGRALNQGISMAKGEYIGIVESDDFISSTMYEKLYNRISEFNADVCIGGFWLHTETTDSADNTHNRQIFANTNDKRLFSIFDYPFLLTVHQSMWAKLYKASFLKKIRFDEEYSQYIDSKFIIDLLFQTKRLIGLKEPVYYYRCDNPNASSSNMQNGKNLMLILDAWTKAKDALKKYGYLEEFKNEFYYQASKAGYRFFINIDKKYKREFFYKWCNFLSEIKKDKSYSFKYLDADRIRFFKACFERNFNKIKFDEYKAFEFCHIPLFLETVKGGRKKYKFFGIKIKQVDASENSKNTRILFNLYKCLKNKDETKKYLCGIPIKTKFYLDEKKYTSYAGGLIKTISTNTKVDKYFMGGHLYKKRKENGKIKKYFMGMRFYNKPIPVTKIAQDVNNVLIQRMEYDIKACLYAQNLHLQTFSKFLNCHLDETVVLVACGPTVNYFSPIKSARYVGVNRSFLKKEVLLDYLFVQDDLGENMQEANHYRSDLCQKFYGIIPHFRNIQCQNLTELQHIKRISLLDAYKANAKQYILHDGYVPYWPYDISKEPLRDAGGIVFSALQFICYTHPKRIYLVGCDCSDGKHFYGGREENFSTRIHCWENFKNYLIVNFPDIEVISVNPIGLRGIFKDVYTQTYLDEHPELMNENVEILNEKGE